MMSVNRRRPREGATSPARGARHALALALCVGAAVASACSEETIAPPEAVRGVLVSRVATPGAQQERTLTGVTRSANTTDLSFRVAGQLVTLGVKTGDLVEGGTLIGRLDRTDFEIELAEARAALTQAEAEVRNADANYARARALYEREGIARTDLEAARASAESGRAGVEAAEQRVRAASRQLGFTRLVAPSAGAISLVPVELRENVTAGQVIAVLQTGGPPEVEVAFPEVLIASVSAGDEVEAEIEAFPGEVYPGVVRKVGVAPEDGGATYPVTVRLETDWDRIRPGMAAGVRFRFRGQTGAKPLVPASAVGEDREGRFVYVVEAAAGDTFTTKRRAIEVGEIGGDGFLVRAGLTGGERIVIAGVPRIRDGLTVRVIDEGDWP